MTWLNHAATGALIAVAANKPAIALPATLLSHFVIDMLPHWDFKYKGGLKQMQAGRLLDLNLAMLFLVVIMLVIHKSPGLILACGLLAILPDAIFLPYFVTGKTNDKYKLDILNKFRDFSLAIQKMETHWGLFVEIGWFLLMTLLIFEV
jgi:hypothetical protein